MLIDVAETTVKEMFDGELGTVNIIKINIREMKTKKLHALSLSAGVNYSFFQTNQFGIVLKAGLSNNLIFAKNQSLNSKFFAQGSKVMEKTVTNQKINTINNFFLSGYSELVFNYKLNSNFSLVFSAGYSHSLTSLREKMSTQDPNTYLRSITTGLGIQFSF